MKTLARFLVITALAATLSGCLGGGEPDTGRSAHSLNAVDVDSVEVAAVPDDLMTCDAFYGADWDTPDAILNVEGRPGMVVLVQGGEMICTGDVDQLDNQGHDLDLGAMIPLNEPGDRVGGEDADLEPGGEQGADNPAGDSNPLPAKPGGETSGENPAGDSNPLPANPANPGGEKTNDNPEGDSNPLPARSEVVQQTRSAGDF